MEFGVFAQLFVPHSERAVDPDAEHKRIIRNVEIAKAADQQRLQVRVVPAAPLPRRVQPHARARGVPLVLRRAAPSASTSARRSSTSRRRSTSRQRIAENVALLDHLSNNRFEFGTGRGSSTTEVLGFDIDDIDDHQGHVARDDPEIPKMWKDAVYSYEGKYFRMPERKVFPKPHGPLAPGDVGRRPARPRTFTEAGELGLGAFCFPSVADGHASRSSTPTRPPSAQPTPVGDYVNDNIMGVTNMLCMEDRKKAFEVAANMGMNYYTTLAYHWLDNMPRADGPPRVAEQDPRADAGAGREAVGGGLRRRRRPRRLRPRRCSGGSTSVSTSSRSARRRTRCRPRSSSRRWSCSGGRSSRSSTRIPSTRPPATAERRRSASGSLAERTPAGLVRRARRLAAPVGPVGRRRPARHAQPDRRRRRPPGRGRGARRATASRSRCGSTSTSPQVGSIPGRINPLRTMVAINTPYLGDPANFCTSDDVVTMGLQASTHWDALAHVSYGGVHVERRPGVDDHGRGRRDEARHPPGAHRSPRVACSSTSPAPAASSGSQPGARHHAPTTSTPPPTWPRSARRAGRRRARPHRPGPAHAASASATSTRPATSPASRRRAAGGSRPTTSPPSPPTPSPSRCTRARTPPCCSRSTCSTSSSSGLTQGQNFDLEALAADCADDGRYTFLLEASPIPFTGGVGAPVNPVAVK